MPEHAEHFAAHGFADMLSNTVQSGQITQPDLRKIHVYEEGSPHFGDQAVIATFQRTK